MAPVARAICEQEGSIWKLRVYHWRAAMEYFLIGMWRDCVPLLDHYDVVGVTLSPAVVPAAMSSGWYPL